MCTTEASTDAGRQPSGLDPAPASLGVLVGKWNVKGRESGPFGEIHGRVSFERPHGGLFLVQRVDPDHIGRERTFGANEPSKEVASRFIDTAGNTLDDVNEMVGDTLTIRGGDVGSPANVAGRSGDDGSSLVGR